MRQISQRRIARTLGTVAILALGLMAGVARASPADGGQAGAALGVAESLPGWRARSGQMSLPLKRRVEPRGWLSTNSG